MAGRLVVEGDQAFDLATRLSTLTGQSVASVVTETLRQRLEVEEQAREKHARTQAILAAAAQLRAALMVDGKLP